MSRKSGNHFSEKDMRQRKNLERIPFQLKSSSDRDSPPTFGRGRLNVLNRTDRSSPIAGEADVKYLDGDFRVVRPGAFVRCAVNGLPIPLEELKYWSVDLQEAYANPEAVLMRHFPNVRRRITEGR